MNVLILGGGGREHAIAWKLHHDDPSIELAAIPGNPGIAEFAHCLPGNPSSPSEVVSQARAHGSDLVVVGPEAPLAAGVADALREAGIAVFGPSRAAARIESSKRFAKELMLRNGIPTAGASWHTDAASAVAEIERVGAPVVVKASGLAAGKGVVVASTVQEAVSAARGMFAGSMGDAGSEVLIEEFMSGEELSVFAVTNGASFTVLPVAQDHKRLLDGDTGPNTGGMGAYAPVSLATDAVLDAVSEQLIAPTIQALAHLGAPFRGLLYCGVMLTPTGPRVVEFNCRFGDPETQAVLPVMDTTLLDLMLWSAGAPGYTRSPVARVSAKGHAVVTVVAAPGYPERPLTGAPLSVPQIPESVLCFHAGTKRGPHDELLSAGGRVLAVTGLGASFDEARHRSRRFAESVGLEGKQLRRDIGWREAARHAGTS